MATYNVAYGEKGKINQSIVNNIIPPGTIILTTDSDEIFFYDLDKNLKVYEQRYKFGSLAEANEWVSRYNCSGQIISVHENNECKAYIVNYDNKLVPVGSSSGSSIISGIGEFSEIFNDYVNNVAGCRGYYYSSIEFGDEIFDEDNNSTGEYGPCVITLSKEQPNDITTAINPDPFSIEWSVGNFITIVNNSKYIRCATIIEVNSNKIVVDKLPFDSIANMAGKVDIDDYTVYCPDDVYKGYIPLGHYSHAEGENTIALERASHSEGRDTIAIGQYSHVEGRETQAYYAAHAEGHKSIAKGGSSHAEGYMTLSEGSYSHAEGYMSESKGNGSHAEGCNTHANGEHSHAEGYATEANAIGSHVEGNHSRASGDYSHAEGNDTHAEGDYSHAEGDKSTASGYVSHAEGCNSIARGHYSHAEGYKTIAGDNYSHAEGSGTEATGIGSHTEGISTKAFAIASHAEGYLSEAHGDYSHAEGYLSKALGPSSHAEGSGTEATGHCAHTEGVSSKASGNEAHAEGRGTIASGHQQHVQGKFNIEDTANRYAHIVGNGIDNDNRRNAHTVDWEGNAWFAGTITLGEDNEEVATKTEIVRKMFNESPTEFVFSFADNYKKEYRLNPERGMFMDSISFTFANGVYTEDYVSGLSFGCGATPTEINYTNSGILNWVGTHCKIVEGQSIFTPQANYHYDIVFAYNGIQFIGYVCGFIPATVAN